MCSWRRGVRISRTVLTPYQFEVKVKKQLARILCVPPGTLTSDARYTMRRMSGTENDSVYSTQARGGSGNRTLGAGSLRSMGFRGHSAPPSVLYSSWLGLDDILLQSVRL